MAKILNHKDGEYELLQKNLYYAQNSAAQAIGRFQNDELGVDLNDGYRGENAIMVMEENSETLGMNSIPSKIAKPEINNDALSVVMGIQDAKEALKEALLFPYIYPHLFNEKRKPVKRILLYGPPGTGKTMLALAVAREIQAPLLKIGSADLLSPWIGESEKLVKQMFERARAIKNSIIFIDEVDSIFRKRSEQETDFRRSFKNTILIDIDAKENNKTFLLCNSNCPWDIDPAFLRRFQRRIYVPLPDRQTRAEILASESGVNLQWDPILDATENYSGSDLSALVQYALMEPIRELETATHWIITADYMLRPVPANNPDAIECSLMSIQPSKVAAREVVAQDFLKALKVCHGSVNPAIIEKYEQFAASF